MKTDAAFTLQDQAYQTLRQGLMLGRWLPGERLKIHTLAREMGMGSMAVRTALQRLVAEKALVNVPNCGVSVPQLGKAEFDDILATRILLEGEAARQGALKLDDDAKAALAALVRQMDEAIAQGDIKAYLDANETFHLTLYLAAGSPMLMTLIETVWLYVGPISNRLHQDAAVWATMNAAHSALLAALLQNDADGVAHAIAEDLRQAGAYLRGLCQD
ncbi:GntR family transcriptional regulator [Craterilacuibacter sp. RT1T]|uniref:GntR family transcriptional regulator n=1 Tax=Craterilacuibacter sp. RT1T TaxID=2942211 RepID=UPI0020BEB4A8|nr:GntR family transcriptional regulator [Craterilacuibacter sp. RT1T]MCL6263180.1 GntR family transcriptional regulator [Craterilacuibacter sp. RT1T]